MTGRKKALLACAGALLVSQACPVPSAEAKQVMVDAKVLEQLQQLVMEQQKQLDNLQKQVSEFQQTAVAAQTQAQEAKTVAEEAKTTAQTPAPQVVTSGSERVKLAISGQVDRAMNLVDDGEDTDLYYVDNNASNTRVRFVGTAGLDEDLTLGTRIEVALAPNLSTDVSQKNQETGNFIEERVAEVSLKSQRFGTIGLGKGYTPSDSTAEVDLSGTDVVQYASISDIAGGMFFRESHGGAFTDIQVKDAFNDFDGLGRKTRLRYDLPTYYGFGLSASAISDSRWDTALRWAGSGYGLKMAAAGAVDYINASNADYQYDGSFSVLHEETGLNFTFSAGTQDAETGDDPYNLWGKLGWQTQFCPLGKTSFAFDYGYSENLTADNDEGETFGLAVVQSLSDYGTELYVQYRQYSLDRDSGPDVDDINVGTVGARVKF